MITNQPSLRSNLTENEEIYHSNDSKFFCKLRDCLKDMQAAIQAVMVKNLQIFSEIDKRTDIVVKEIEKIERNMRVWIAASKQIKIDDDLLNEVKKFKKSIQISTLQADQKSLSFLENLYCKYDNQIFDEISNTFNNALRGIESSSQSQKEDSNKEEKKEIEEPNKPKRAKSRRNHDKGSDVNEYDVLIVMRYTKVSKLEAIEALKATKGNFTNAILYITTGKIPLDD